MPQDGASPRSGNLKELLRSRKRAQKPVSCEPCRERKVKCDKGHPCTTCAKRGYPDLCVYPETGAGGRGPAGPRPQKQRLHPGPATSSPAPDRCSVNATPIPPAGSEPHYTPASLTAGGGIIDSELPNSNSTVALSRGASPLGTDSSDHRTAFGLGILPLLGAVEAESGTAEADGAWKSTLAVLDVERGVLDLFQSYRRNVHPFHAIPFDLDEIEKKFCLLLNLRDTCGEQAGEAGPVRDPNWLCLLNAILAAGAQASEMPLERRISMSRLHSERRAGHVVRDKLVADSCHRS